MKPTKAQILTILSTRQLSQDAQRRFEQLLVAEMSNSLVNNKKII